MIEAILQDLDNLTAEELTHVIKKVRDLQKKHTSVLEGFINNFEEPTDKYTLKDLFNNFKSYAKEQKLNVLDEKTFNIGISNALKNKYITLDNLRLNAEQKTVPINKPVYGDVVSDKEVKPINTK